MKCLLCNFQNQNDEELKKALHLFSSDKQLQLLLQ